MVTSKIRFHQSLMGKILLYAALPIAFVLTAVIGYTAHAMYYQLLAVHEKNIVAHAENAAAEINAKTLEAVTTVRTMAMAQEAGLFGKREESRQFAREVLEENPDITGAYFGYEPNADQDDREYLQKMGDDRGGLDEKGRFIPYWFRDHNDPSKIRLNPLVDMETSLYYNGVRERFQSGSKVKHLVTEPYTYEGKQIFEQVYPIVIGGRFVGIAGVDASLDQMERDLRREAAEWGVDVLVVSRLGKIVSATMDPALKTKPIGQTMYKDILEELHEQRKVVLEVRTDPTDNESYYFVAAPIPIGEWTLVVRVPEYVVVEQITATIRNVIIFSIVGATLVIGLLIYVARSITGGIREAVDAAERVATGNLVCGLEIRTNDEVGQLLSAIRVMTHDLNSVVKQVVDSSIQLTSTATQLTAASKEQDRTVATFGGSTSQITAAVKEISATSQELVSTMNEVTHVATDTASLADSGRSGLTDMEATMRQLSDATNVVSGKLGTIRERADDINLVVTTITKVADQTNLLSINAAIEAEKAGDYGTGFLVVAKEIRRLADQTAVATLDIERMVREMHVAVSEGVTEMERFAGRVCEAVDEVGSISGKLEMIIEQVKALTPQFENVNEGMRSQSQGAEQIRDAMVQLSEGARQSANSVREFTRAGDNLQQAVVGLREAVSRFKVSS